MRYVDCIVPVIAVLSTVGVAAVRSNTGGPVFIHSQRYAMGTMFDIAAYHPVRAPAERAIESALARTIREGHRTADLVTGGQKATSCSKFAQLVAERI